jgi:hypothetical protein
VALATLLSPLTPVGEARLATGSPGAVAIDPLVTLAGALATLVIVVALSVWPAIRHARLSRSDPPRRTAAAAVRAAAWIGGPPSALIGVRYALERGRGPQSVPVGTALLGMVLAVAALCATAVFGASLTRLISSPALYGVPYQAEFTNEGTGLRLRHHRVRPGQPESRSRGRADHPGGPRSDRRERPPGPSACGHRHPRSSADLGGGRAAAER